MVRCGACGHDEKEHVGLSCGVLMFGERCDCRGYEGPGRPPTANPAGSPTVTDTTPRGDS